MRYFNNLCVSLHTDETTASEECTDQNTADRNDESECCICLNAMEFPITLDCGHSFCFLCLKDIRLQSASSFNLSMIRNHCIDSDSMQAQNCDEMVETFCCPYCRKEYDAKIIDNANMNKSDWINADIQTENEGIVVWKYAGRNGGWFVFIACHFNVI